MAERKDLKKGEVRGFLQQRKMEYKVGSNNNLILLFCPYCKGGERRDKYTFAISEKSGAYICFRVKCGAKGHFNQLKIRKDDINGR